MRKPQLFSLFLFMGFLLTTVEFILNLNNSSLCHTQGCSVVDSFAKSETLMVLAGAGFFGISFLLSLLKRIPYREQIINILLIAALSVEGYLLGFQTFIVHTFCLFCLIVASLIVVTSVFRFLLMKQTSIIYGFLSLAIVFTATWFVNPSIEVLPDTQYTLIYSKDCPHCHQVIEFCEKNNVNIPKIEVTKIKGVCRSFGINQVPVLVCNCNPQEKRIIQGDKAIIGKLSDLIVPEVSAGLNQNNEKKSRTIKRKPQPEKPTIEKQEKEIPLRKVVSAL